MKKLILTTALVALSSSSFAARTQNPAEICGTAIPGIGYTSVLTVGDWLGNTFASTGHISLGQTKCVKVPKMPDETIWYVRDMPLGSIFHHTVCADFYIYHASTSHGEAWYKMWGNIRTPYCGRAG